MIEQYSSGILSTIKSYVPRKVLISLYFAICQSYLFYCTPIWACGSKASLESIFVGQKRAIRILTGTDANFYVHAREHTKPLFKKLDILTIHNIYIYTTATEAYKLYKQFGPTQFNNYSLGT